MKRGLGQDESPCQSCPPPLNSLLLLSDLTWEREGPKERERAPGFVEEASRCALSCKGGAGSEERTLLKAKTFSHTASSLLPGGFVKEALPQSRPRAALTSRIPYPVADPQGLEVLAVSCRWTKARSQKIPRCPRPGLSAWVPVCPGRLQHGLSSVSSIISVFH